MSEFYEELRFDFLKVISFRIQIKIHLNIYSHRNQVYDFSLQCLIKHKEFSFRTVQRNLLFNDINTPKESAKMKKDRNESVVSFTYLLKCFSRFPGFN